MALAHHAGGLRQAGVRHARPGRAPAVRGRISRRGGQRPRGSPRQRAGEVDIAAVVGADVLNEPGLSARERKSRGAGIGRYLPQVGSLAVPLTPRFPSP